MHILEVLNTALHNAFAADDCVYLLGEDVLDPYGGAFKVTRGLSSKYPARVLTTPISEAGITGVAAGMALRGLRPVVEIMFGDFITLAADQLVNHIAKFRWMYNDQVRVPMVLRTPMGGRRGYGPTHSQTLEKLFLGVPGLRILAPCAFQAGGNDAGTLLENAILHTQDPVLYIENKLLYLLPLMDGQPDFAVHLLPHHDAPEAPFYQVTIQGAPPAILTIAAYGYSAELARQAALALAYQHEVFVEMVVPTQLSPFVLGPILDSAARTRRLLAVEEGNLSLGWGAEIIAQAAERIGPQLLCAARCAARDLPIPASGVLEQAVLPGVDRIIRAALEIAGRNP
jgi:pyruvate/2-oxoglutarate/acetoin dehydrogenase E1 component